MVSFIVGLILGDGKYGDPSDATTDFLFRSWKIPKFFDGLIIIGSGFLSGIGMFFISHAYRSSKGSTVASFEYIAVPFAVFWSISLFGNWPDNITWFGIILIIIAGILN